MNKFVLCINENENVLLLMLFLGRRGKLGSEQERKCIQFHIRREIVGERESVLNFLASFLLLLEKRC